MRSTSLRVRTSRSAPSRAFSRLKVRSARSNIATCLDPWDLVSRIAWTSCQEWIATRCGRASDGQGGSGPIRLLVCTMSIYFHPAHRSQNRHLVGSMHPKRAGSVGEGISAELIANEMDEMIV